MSEKRVLFVDDEQHVLDGLGNLLRKHRKRWQMAFARSAAEALTELAKTPYDVVVTDMRMPGMDGTALLEKVKQMYPGTARIILSGHAEQESGVRSLAVAHQFLNKPCTGEALTTVIERTCALKSLLQDASVRDVIGKLDKLPSAPKTYFELMSIAEDPDSGIADLARVVERDTAMSIKVLQLVNSAFFGLAHPMVSVSRAVNYLGSDLLKGLALNAHVFGMLDRSTVPGFSLERVQEQALLCGRLAGHFVEDKKGSEEAMTAGFVKDAGKIILCLALPETFARVVQATQISGRPLHLVEQEMLGLTHAEIGAYLLGIWGLPFPIVEAVAYQHRPALVVEGDCAVLAAVHLSIALLEELEHGDPTTEPQGALDTEFLDRLGLGPRLPEWRNLAKREFLARRADKA